MITVIKTKKFRNNSFAYVLSNGNIEIEGITYIFYSLTDAIRVHRRNYPIRKRNNIN